MTWGLGPRNHDQDLRALREASQRLAVSAPLSETAQIVASECQKILKADAVCIHTLAADDVFVLQASLGCTDDFNKKWQRVPRSLIPQLRDGDVASIYFWGTAADMKKNIPLSSELVDKSGREAIAYTPFLLNGRVRGILGFSYNHKSVRPPNQEMVLTLAAICGSALEHARLFEQERASQQQACQANDAKTAFVAGISHEMRSPIGVIQGFADLIYETSKLDSETRQWVAGIRRNARQLSRLIGDVLDLAKIEARKIEVENLAFSTREIFSELKESFELQAAEKSVNLVFKIDGLPTRIVSDPSRLRQILINLLSNALKFTFHGRIELVAAIKGGYLEIRVADTGVGIPEDRQHQIFEPFEQAEKSTTRRFGGTGLGLSISKTLAEALGGTLYLERSAPGMGSSFVCTIQCQLAESSVEQKSVALQLEEDLTGLSVLLVEDNPDNQDLIKEVLQRAGATVEVANNGASGVQQALRKRFDVILMDIQMPGIDGFKAVSLLRQKGYQLPVAALTANALKDDVDTCQEHGFDEYLTKPIDRPRLIEAIRRLALH